MLKAKAFKGVLFGLSAGVTSFFLLDSIIDIISALLDDSKLYNCK
jgi:hypothetical protein